jgi:hypothetical protein
VRRHMPVPTASREGVVVEPKQRAIDALIEKYREQLRLMPADMLPAPV